MFYTHGAIDRADHLRKDEDTLKTLRSRKDARIVPVWKNQSLVNAADDHSEPQAMFLAQGHPFPEGQSIFLGQEQGSPFFAVDVSHLSETQCTDLAAQAINRKGDRLASRFVDLRIAGPGLSDPDGSLLAYSRGLVYWNANTQYCIRCAQALDSMNGGHVRRCSNPDCAYMVFPRTDPAVIMLVCHTPADGGEPLCLLGRSAAWPDGVFSALAGFVEPGESLEQAVQREVLEEASIHTCDVRYVASQPWPFPRSIMLGFEASATSTDIQCDPHELADAQWFTRAQIRQFGNWGDSTKGYKLPRVDSIARFLIDRWVNQ